MAASLIKDTGDHEKSWTQYLLRRTELAYSALYARAVESFVFKITEHAYTKVHAVNRMSAIQAVQRQLIYILCL